MHVRRLEIPRLVDLGRRLIINMWGKIKKILRVILEILSEAHDAGLINQNQTVPTKDTKGKPK